MRDLAKGKLVKSAGNKKENVLSSGAIWDFPPYGPRASFPL